MIFHQPINWESLTGHTCHSFERFIYYLWPQDHQCLINYNDSDLTIAGVYLVFSLCLFYLFILLCNDFDPRIASICLSRFRKQWQSRNQLKTKHPQEKDLKTRWAFGTLDFSISPYNANDRECNIGFWMVGGGCGRGGHSIRGFLRALQRTKATLPPPPPRVQCPSLAKVQRVRLVPVYLHSWSEHVHKVI